MTVAKQNKELKEKSLALWDAYTSAVLVHILECDCGLDTR